jgi:hypothetical protein
MNQPTIIVLLIVLAMVIVAIHFLRMGKGKCSCGENGKKTAKSQCASCSADCPLKQ